MAVTHQDYTGNGSTAAYNITAFDFLDTGDVFVSVAGVTQNVDTNYTVSGTTLTFTSGSIPANNAAIRIYRDTNVDSAKHTYQAGASVKADNLNDNHKQFLYKLQEIGAVTTSTAGIALTTGDKNDIKVNSATDWVIRPGAIEASMLDALAIGSSNIASGAVDTVNLAADAVDGTKIEDNAIDSEHYTDGSIDHVHLSGDCVEGDNIADNAVGQEHIEANSIGSTQMLDDSVGVAELSATGTASADTVLHGDNRWALPGPIVGFGSALTTNSVTGSQDTWVDTGLTINYTPKSTSSTIHVTGFVHMFGSANNTTSGTSTGAFKLRLRVLPSGGSETTVGEEMTGTFGTGVNSTYTWYATRKEFVFAFHEKYGNSSTTQKTFHIECREEDNAVLEICKNTGHSFINVMEVV
jgi:hypothetical protein